MTQVESKTNFRTKQRLVFQTQYTQETNRTDYAGINFIQNHSPGHYSKGAKTLPRENYCVQNPSPRHKTGSQKPHPRDIKLENFTNTG